MVEPAPEAEGPDVLGSFIREASCLSHGVGRSLSGKHFE